MDRLASVMQRLFERETDDARRELDVETGDLWRFVRVASDSEGEEEDHTGFVVLVVLHIITEGVGDLEFFSQLLQRAIGYDQGHERVRHQADVDVESQPLLRSGGPSTTLPSTKTKTTMRPLPPTLKSTIRLKPAISTLLRSDLVAEVVRRRERCEGVERARRARQR